MQYYKKVDFEFVKPITQYALNFINTHKLLVGHQQTTITTSLITFPDELTELINNELANYNIPNLSYARLYLSHKNTEQYLHIDGNQSVQLHCAINIPLMGGENSILRWVGGEYETEVAYQSSTGQYFHTIKDQSNVQIAESIEMTDGAYLIRIDVPHQGISSPDSDRWILTLRFKNNPTFEYVYGQLCKQSN